MALSTFPSDMNAAASAVLSCAAAFRAIATQSGDLTWRMLEDAQNSLHIAKSTSIVALSSASSAPAAAEAYMASIGGPASISDFQASLAAVETAAAAWNVALSAFLASLPTNQLLHLATRDVGLPTETKYISRPAFIPGQYAAALRAEPSLSALIAAFEAVGA
jgi:hypothetical protein